MRQVRLTVTPRDPSIHPFFAFTAGGGAIQEARSLHCNVADGNRPTYLFAIRGDDERIDAELDGYPEIIAYEISTDNDDLCYVNLQLESNEIGHAILDAFSHDNLTLVLPVIYAEGRATMEIVGTHTALQEFVDALPSVLQVDVEAIRELTDGDSADAILTERQREAVLAGLELGYYETPRQTTHEDVAERLGCSPSTASEHLNRAESKLIKAMVNRT